MSFQCALRHCAWAIHTNEVKLSISFEIIRTSLQLILSIEWWCCWFSYVNGTPAQLNCVIYFFFHSIVNFLSTTIHAKCRTFTVRFCWFNGNIINEIAISNEHLPNWFTKSIDEEHCTAHSVGYQTATTHNS